MQATDADGDPLVYWADHLPPGASFDASSHALVWTPDFHSAGTYPDVQFFVSDGLHQVSETTTVVIAPTPQPPTLLQPAAFTGREGDPIHIQLQASDVHGAPLTFSSDLLPPGAFLDPTTGVFEWTPDFTQHGVYQVPVTVSNGADEHDENLRYHRAQREWRTGLPESRGVPGSGGPAIAVPRLRPSTPTTPPTSRPIVRADGSLVFQRRRAKTVTYTVSGLPGGATFDPDTLILHLDTRLRRFGAAHGHHHGD